MPSALQLQAWPQARLPASKAAEQASSLEQGRASWQAGLKAWGLR